MGCGNSVRKAMGFIAATLIFIVLSTSFIPTAYAQSKQSDNPHFELMMETEHFKVYFHPSDENVAHQIIDVCEEGYQKLLVVYGGSPPNSTQIFIFHTYEELLDLGNPPPSLTKEVWERSSGGCFTHFGRLSQEVGEHIEAYNPRLGGVPEIMGFIGHEGGHRFFYYAFPQIRFPIRPNWLDEGMAVYAGTRTSGIVPAFMFQPIVDSVKTGDPPLSSIAELDKLQASPYGKLFDLFYGEAGTIIEYIAERYGKDALLQSIREYDRSLSLEGAVLKTFNISFNQLESEWMQSIKETAAQAKDGSDFYNLLLYPTTTISLSGVLGKNGWYTSELTVTLPATDHISGVDKTEYSFDNATWTTYATPFVVTRGGCITVYYRSTDKAGNTETTKAETIKVDTTPPTITITSPSASHKIKTSMITVGWTGSDDTSGISHYKIGLDNYPLIDVGTKTTHIFSGLGDGNHTLEVQVTDRAGLTSHDSLIIVIERPLLEVRSGYGMTNGSGRYDSGSIVEIKAIPPATSAEERYIWKGWIGTGTASYSGTENPARIMLTDSIVEEASWARQFYLKIVSDRGQTSGEAWYDANSTATISTKTTAPMDGVIGLLGGKYAFNGWTGGITSSEPTVSVLMNSPKTVTATWKEDYTLTYVILGIILVVVLIAARAKLMRKDVLGKQGRALEKA